MSEEDDYMSDKFLTGAADIRPSLVHNHAKKRQIQVEHKRKEHIKKQKEHKATNSAEANNDKLQMALSKPLEAENKGFKLLAKMGYKPGQTLGKPNTEESSSSTSTQHQRLLEPIGITLKTDRQGLGRETALRELKERRQQIRMERMRKSTCEVTTVEEFRRRTTQKHEEKFTLSALRKCQVTCENLDLESQIQQPEMPWFWPERSKETDDDDENKEDTPKSDDDDLEMEEEFTNSEKLELLTSYVRTSYYFCYWCGVRYSDEQDLKDNCPGLTKDDH